MGKPQGFLEYNRVDAPVVPEKERIENEKKRRLVYRDAMSECRNETYVSIIKSVQQKKEDCIKLLRTSLIKIA